MELQELPGAGDSETEEITGIENQPMDRIAFELWQSGSVPAAPETEPVEIEEVASHASCL